MLLTREWYMHPNGQLPAYEWAFGDVNPPVHAWAAWRVFQIDRKQRGDAGDLRFLERVFHKLLLNFTWWVNRKDADGRQHLPGRLPRARQHRRLRPQRAAADRRLHRAGRRHGLDGDVLPEPDAHRARAGAAQPRLRGHRDQVLRALPAHRRGDERHRRDDGRRPVGRGGRVLSTTCCTCPTGTRIAAAGALAWSGSIPLFAVETLEPRAARAAAGLHARGSKWFLEHRPDLAELVSRWHEPGVGERRLLSLLRGHRMKRLLQRMLDESEFLSPYGVRSLSRIHLDHPYVFDCDGQHYASSYEPGESTPACSAATRTGAGRSGSR